MNSHPITTPTNVQKNSKTSPAPAANPLPMQGAKAKERKHPRIGALCRLVASTVLLCLLASCSPSNATSTDSLESDTDSTESSTERVTERVEEATREVYTGDPYFQVGDKTFTYASEEERQSWEEPLAKLLSNEHMEYPDEWGPGMITVLPDPDSPYVEKSYRCGLMDLTGDGVPELLVQPYGGFGSSGIQSFYAYDIYTGEQIGEIHSGRNICVYYNTEDGNLQIVNQYTWSWGTSGYEDYLSFITYSEEKASYVVQEYLYADYHYTAEADAEGNWYTGENYEISGETVSESEYNAQLEAFLNTYVCIPATKFVLISWNDVSSNDDDRIERGRKMAEALVSSAQQFIVPEK
jgi:hypothetical protein